MSAGALSDEALAARGRSLREIDPTSLTADPDEGRARWLLGDSGTELFTWTREGALVPHHVQLVFARRSVEWSEAEGLVTGELLDEPADVLKTHVWVDVPICQAARTLLAASGLTQSDLGGMLGALAMLTR